MRGGRIIATVCGLVALMAGAAGFVITGARLGSPAAAQARPAFSPMCSDPFPARREKGNPLMLATAPPASDPLGGAQFFVDGPAHGLAAGAILHLLGIDTGTAIGHPQPGFANDESYLTFLRRTVDPRLSHVSAGTRHKITELEKIASQPEAQRISAYSAGGGPKGIYDQTQKLFCENFNADPGTIPIITTYFLHAVLKNCATAAQMRAYDPRFKAQIGAMKDAIGNRPVVLLLELDAVGSSSCMARRGDLGDWEGLLRQEVDILSALPHAVVYLEGGYSDSGNSPAYAARMLNRSGISRIAGFFSNDTHLNWAAKEIAYDDKISARTHGKHFIVNTADDGRGPKLNPHPVTQGIEDLCNAPGRGLGPKTTTTRPTLKDGLSDTHLDALMWTHPPGNSSGCGGGPPGGDFWPARAIGLAERANQKLGPGYPSRPY